LSPRILTESIFTTSWGYIWIFKKIAGLSQSNNLEKKVFQAARLLLLPCHCRLVFKLFLLLQQCFGHIC